MDKSGYPHTLEGNCHIFLYKNRFFQKNYAELALFTGAEKHTPLISKALFDACQKIKAIRAQRTRISHANEISKPFMSLLKCGVCGHTVTGEIHKKANGKIYIYYHCANSDCDQRRNHIRQEYIVSQLQQAFEPFSKLTPKATTAFIENVKGQLASLSVYASERLRELEAKKASIEERCVELKEMVASGRLSESEWQEIFAQKQKTLCENEVEIEAHVKANQQTFVAGLKVIELLGKSCDFMNLDGNELDKARLVKLVLSNLILRDGNVQYDYQKPFDDLVCLTRSRNPE